MVRSKLRIVEIIMAVIIMVVIVGLSLWSIVYMYDILGMSTSETGGSVGGMANLYMARALVYVLVVFVFAMILLFLYVAVYVFLVMKND